MNYFLEPLLRHHDRKQFEIYCFADELWSDAKTLELRALVDQWRDIRGLNDDAVAKLVRDEKIDILVDLAGHTGNNRLMVFARRPAPVQVTYLGYPDTTGLQTMDYRLTDALADPIGKTETLHTEQLIRLPHSAWCYHPPAECPEPGELPAMESNVITFGCMNVLPKISSQSIDLWAQILAAVPGSKLLLKNRGLENAANAQRMRDGFAQRGIAAERLEFRRGEPSYLDHLEVYQRVDIAMDPFPYHGTTNTCEALWMGLPVITLAGDVHVSRVGVSLLNQVGLTDLIANSPQEYVQIAVGLANNLPRLTQLRRNLRDRMRGSSLCDAARFTRDLEGAYRSMWEKWCDPAPR